MLGLHSRVIEASSVLVHLWNLCASALDNGKDTVGGISEDGGCLEGLFGSPDSRCRVYHLLNTNVVAFCVAHHQNFGREWGRWEGKADGFGVPGGRVAQAGRPTRCFE